MKIIASTPDAATYVTLYISALNCFNSMKNYGNEFTTDLYYVIGSSILLGAMIGIFAMRMYGWILPEKETNKKEEFQ